MAYTKKSSVIMTYDYRLHKDIQTDCSRTLDFLLPIENNLIKSLWSENFLNQVKGSTTKQAGKWLEIQLERPFDVPSRIWRGVLEIVGRILRTQADKQDLFYFLKSITTDEQQWCWQLCKDNGRQFVKANYIYSLKGAVEAYRKKNDNRFPETYFDITRCPRLKNGVLTYAPDDGQAIRYELKGTTLKVCLKVLSKESKWVWKDASFAIPDIVLNRLEDGTMKSPDLRQKNGKVFLDLKIETKVEPSDNPHKNNLFVDWGVTRKLLAIIIVTPDGTQLGSPIFLKYEGIFRKLHRIRQSIDQLKKTRKKIARRKNQKRWDEYSLQIFRRWEKYHQLQKQIAHLASNVIIDLALAFNCDSIYAEDLATLNAKKYSRWLNRVINSTVRSQIYNKVEYKGKLKGIKLQRPIKAWDTSQYCPYGSGKGHRYTSSDGTKCAGGGWFISDGCSLDADYVACKNLARRVLFDFSLLKAKALAYKERATLAKQFRQGSEGLRNLQRALSGWTHGANVVPLSLQHPLRV